MIRRHQISNRIQLAHVEVDKEQMEVRDRVRRRSDDCDGHENFRTQGLDVNDLDMVPHVLSFGKTIVTPNVAEQRS